MSCAKTQGYGVAELSNKLSSDRIPQSTQPSIITKTWGLFWIRCRNVKALREPADGHHSEAVVTGLCASYHPGEVPRRLSWAAGSELETTGQWASSGRNPSLLVGWRLVQRMSWAKERVLRAGGGIPGAGSDIWVSLCIELYVLWEQGCYLFNAWYLRCLKQCLTHSRGLIIDKIMDESQTLRFSWVQWALDSEFFHCPHARGKLSLPQCPHL